jgi:hypothetical protein
MLREKLHWQGFVALPISQGSEGVKIQFGAGGTSSMIGTMPNRSGFTRAAEGRFSCVDVTDIDFARMRNALQYEARPVALVALVDAANRENSPCLFVVSASDREEYRVNKSPTGSFVQPDAADCDARRLDPGSQKILTVKP